MRILQVVPLVDDAGTYSGHLTAALGQCRELRRRGHDAALVAGWRGSSVVPTQLEGVPAHLFPARVGLGGFSIALTSWLRREAEQIDLAHLHLARSAIPVRAAATLRCAGVAYVAQTHGTAGWSPTSSPSSRSSDRLGVLRTLRRASHRLTTDPGEYPMIAAATGSETDLTLLRQGIWPSAPYARRPLNHGTLDVLTVTDTFHTAAMMTFARVAASLSDSGVDARFCVVGPPGGRRQELLDFIAAHPHLHGRLQYEGGLSHERTLDRIRRADLYVAPASESLPPPALLEALAIGIPTICTTAFAFADTLRSRRGSLVVDPTESALAAGVRSLAGDPGARAELATRGKLAAAHAFDIAETVDELLAVYESVMDRSRTAPPRRAAVTAPDHTDITLDDDPSGPGLEPGLDALTAGQQPSDLLWVTTEVTAYRLALWREIGRTGRLTIALVDRTRANTRLQVQSPREPFQVILLDAGGEAGSGTAVSATLRSQLRRRPDAVVIDGQQSSAFAHATRWARRYGVPVVASYGGESDRSVTIGNAVAEGQQQLLHQADAVLVSEPHDEDQLRRLGVPAERITVAARVPDQQPRLLAPSGPSPAGVVDLRGHHYLFLGPADHPGLPELVEAFATLRAPEDRLTVAGQSSPTGALPRLVRTLELGSCVQLRGPSDDKARAALLGRAHTLVLLGLGQPPGPTTPPPAELLDEALDEARAAGVHVVVSDCGDGASAIGLSTVFLARPTPRSLTEAMIMSRERWTGRHRTTARYVDLADSPALGSTRV